MGFCVCEDNHIGGGQKDETMMSPPMSSRTPQQSPTIISVVFRNPICNSGKLCRITEAEGPGPTYPTIQESLRFVGDTTTSQWTKRLRDNGTVVVVKGGKACKKLAGDEKFSVVNGRDATDGKKESARCRKRGLVVGGFTKVQRVGEWEENYKPWPQSH